MIMTRNAAERPPCIFPSLHYSNSSNWILWIHLFIHKSTLHFFFHLFPQFSSYMTPPPLNKSIAKFCHFTSFVYLLLIITRQGTEIWFFYVQKRSFFYVQKRPFFTFKNVHFFTFKRSFFIFEYIEKLRKIKDWIDWNQNSMWFGEKTLLAGGFFAIFPHIFISFSCVGSLLLSLSVMKWINCWKSWHAHFLFRVFTHWRTGGTDGLVLIVPIRAVTAAITDKSQRNAPFPTAGTQKRLGGRARWIYTEQNQKYSKKHTKKHIKKIWRPLPDNGYEIY